MKHLQVVDLRRMRHGTIHTHACGCGDYFVCHAEADKCAVPTHYQCPNCAQDQADDYFREEAQRKELAEVTR